MHGTLSIPQLNSSAYLILVLRFLISSCASNSLHVRDGSQNRMTGLTGRTGAHRVRVRPANFPTCNYNTMVSKSVTV